uniref:Ribosomal protein S3 n=1 Tax=Halamphora calidilacuna TaxID=2133758 RepID=A0A2R4A3Q2_9STRA|nr:ribosomal protein S3 [Halamphora calidilacuna]
MGQKTNPNILRLGKVKEWKSKYIEKKSTESCAIIFQDLEIKKFIFHLFAKNEFKVQNCRIYYSESSMHIYISYYNFLVTNKKVKLKLINSYSKKFQNKALSIEKANAKKQLYLAKTYKKKFSHQTQKELLQNHYFLYQKTQRLEAINSFKVYGDTRHHKTFSKHHANLFISKLLKGLTLFTKKKHNIFLNLKQVNKETSCLQKTSKKNKYKLKKNLAKLRKFQSNEFFKKGLNMLHTFIINTQNAIFLAEFIASYLKKLKRPNFFLRFLKIALKMFLNKKFSKFERIQIKIKGRFNGAPRSSHKYINIGRNIPVLTIDSNIDYGESTAYTSNGTFGIKIWTYATTYKKRLC